MILSQISRTELQARLSSALPPVLLEALPEGYFLKGHLPTARNFPHDQARELALVAARMIGKVLLRRARVAREEAEHLAFHVRQAVRPIAVLPRAVQVHHRVDRLEHVVRRRLHRGYLVDMVNRFAHSMTLSTNSDSHGNHRKHSIGPARAAGSP